ncbi:MAG: hypothetical protein VCA36_13180, partial [Opitutales bacterium]
KEFLQAFPLDKSSSRKPLIYVVIDDLDQVRSNLLISFQQEFIAKWQELGVIDSFRFIASSSQWPLRGAAVRFIESVAGQEPLLVRLAPLTEEECGELARKRGINTISGSELFARTKGIPSHVEDELEMHAVTREPLPAGSDVASLPEGLSDQQTQWVARAACLNSLTVEGLSLFYDRKEAIEAFNWLRYSSNLTHRLPGRTIGLNPNSRQAALDWFRKSDPSGAQAAMNRAERLADFQARIPTEDERRMLLLLSHFLFFDVDVLKAVVGEKAEEYMAFIKKRPEWFVQTTYNYQMLPEYRDICQRFHDLIGVSSMDQETRQKILACWERKKQTNTQKQNLLRSEESKLHEELASVDHQAKSLESAREQILNPVEESFVASRGKKRRQVKIGTSFGFLTLGIVVLGLSLGMRDLFSVYHAAAGIFLTMAGFFWPIVVHEAPAAISASGMNQFAVETQQRVLQFRLNGLDTRRAKLKTSLGGVHREARGLEEILEEPYLRED